VGDKTVGPVLYGERMFESQADGFDAALTMSLISHAHRLVVERECVLVDLAAHWADLHHPAGESAVTPTLPSGEHARRLGGEGTPVVLEFAAAELGARMETAAGSARSLMADALDLRHRLPEFWALIRAGRCGCGASQDLRRHPPSELGRGAPGRWGRWRPLWSRCHGTASRRCWQRRSSRPIDAYEVPRRMREAMSCGCPRAVSRSRPGPAGASTWITPCRTGRQIEAARRIRPRLAILVR
jgi:hypothetical protein